MVRRKAKKRKSQSLESQSSARKEPAGKPAVPPTVQSSGKSAEKPAVPATDIPYPKLEPTPEAVLGSQATDAEFDVVEAWRKYWGHGRLSDWQRLCRDLGVLGDMSSEEKCKEVCRLLPLFALGPTLTVTLKALAGTWVNIHDFLRTANKLEVVHFSDQRALAEYTRATKKAFPRAEIDKGSPLALLMARSSNGPSAKKQTAEVKKEDHRKKHPKKYTFVPPPETYDIRRKGLDAAV